MRATAALAAAGLCALPTTALADEAPIRRSGDGKLGNEMVWRVGDRGSTISLRLGIEDEQIGFINVREISTGNYVIAEGYAMLSPGDSSRLMRLEKTADFQSLPAAVPDHAGGDIGANGVEAVYFCRSSLMLSETHGDGKKTVQRGCPRDKADPALRYAKALVRFAQGHFTDFGPDAIWHDALQ